jgi:hypothetical protein
MQHAAVRILSIHGHSPLPATTLFAQARPRPPHGRD